MAIIDLEMYQNTPLLTEYQSIQQICNPLKKMGIQGFIFIRHYQDGTFLDFSNQLEWSTYFLSRYLAKEYRPVDIKDHMFIEDGVSLWVLNSNNIIWQEGQQHFGFGNGISISQAYPHYQDVCCFYAAAKDSHMNKFYINNLDVLKLFIKYFKDRARNVINKSNNKRFYTPDIYQVSGNSEILRKSKVNSIKKYFVSRGGYANEHIENVSSQLTLREMQCLQLCAHGLSAKQIAADLSVSNRTIEARIKSAKVKLDCKNICELMYKFTKDYMGGFLQE